MKLEEGSTVLVTGASSGIGAALARALAARRVSVGLVARRADRLEQVLADCQKTAPKARMWTADLGDLELAERVALEAWDTFGHLDVLVNNAGIPKRRHVTELRYPELEEVIRVNFLSPARMTLALRIGEREFSALHQQGDQSQIFMAGIDDDTVLVTVFGPQTTLGLVRFYSARTIKRIAAVLQENRSHQHVVPLFTEHDVRAATTIFGR